MLSAAGPKREGGTVIDVDIDVHAQRRRERSEGGREGCMCDVRVVCFQFVVVRCGV